jgi:hypothetical protein
MGETAAVPGPAMIRGFSVGVAQGRATMCLEIAEPVGPDDALAQARLRALVVGRVRAAGIEPPIACRTIMLLAGPAEQSADELLAGVLAALVGGETNRVLAAREIVTNCSVNRRALPTEETTADD